MIYIVSKQNEYKIQFELHGLLCVVFFRDKGLFCCTHECGGFETVSDLKMDGSKYVKSTTVPRWTNSKEDLIWLLMLRETEKNEVID